MRNLAGCLASDTALAKRLTAILTTLAALTIPMAAALTIHFTVGSLSSIAGLPPLTYLACNTCLTAILTGGLASRFASVLTNQLASALAANLTADLASSFASALTNRLASVLTANLAALTAHLTSGLATPLTAALAAPLATAAIASSARRRREHCRLRRAFRRYSVRHRRAEVFEDRTRDFE